MMKYFQVFICLILCSGIFGDDVYSKLMNSVSEMKECAAAYNVPSDFQSKINVHKLTELLNNEEDTRNLGCYTACAFEKLGWMTGTELNADTLKQNLYTILEEKAEMCTKNLDGIQDKCEMGHKFIECLVKAGVFTDL